MKPQPQRLGKWLRVTQLAWNGLESETWFLIGYSPTYLLLPDYHHICLSALTHRSSHGPQSMKHWLSGPPQERSANLWLRWLLYTCRNCRHSPDVCIWCRNRPQDGQWAPPARGADTWSMNLGSPGGMGDTKKHVRPPATPVSLWPTPSAAGESPEQPGAMGMASNIKK